MSALATLAMAAALLQQGVAAYPRPAAGAAPELTLSCRIKGPDRVRFHLQSTPLRAGPAKNPRLHYAALRVTGIDRRGAQVDAATLAAIDTQLQTFRPLQGGAHVVCAKGRASLVILGWRDKTPVRLVLRAPVRGLAGFAVAAPQPGWTL